MRQWLIMVMITVLSLSLSTGCKKRREIVQEAGLLNREFTLRQMPPPGSEAVFPFFHLDNPQALYFGEKRITFMWGRISGELNVTKVALGNIGFILDAAKEAPTIRFEFYQSWLDHDTSDDTSASYAANILTKEPVLPNSGVYGVTLRLNRQHYIELMLAIAGIE